MRTSLVALLLVTACAEPKAPVSDDFSDLTGQDEKSDAFSYRMKVVGSLDYGHTSASIHYTSSPRYRAVKFGGSAGDQVDVRVHSASGDSVAWVLDNNFHILGSNDDADASTLDSHVALTLPANPSVTHYIVFRDYDLATHNFTVTLGGAAYDTSCTTDADCTAVPTGGCCVDGTLTAVNVAATDEYAAATACTVMPRPFCPQHQVYDTRVSECDAATNHCVMIEPQDIHCGGFINHPHTCPAGFGCVVSTVPDVGASCTPTPP
jgi:hypothetical protein